MPRRSVASSDTPAAALAELARALGVPVAHTLTGKGAIPCMDPLSAGLFARYDRIANSLTVEADVLLVVGCKLTGAGSRAAEVESEIGPVAARAGVAGPVSW